METLQRVISKQPILIGNRFLRKNGLETYPIKWHPYAIICVYKELYPSLKNYVTGLIVNMLENKTLNTLNIL